MSCWIITILIFTGFTTTLAGQIRLPEGKFLQDSISPGRPVEFSLSFQHPASQVVLFPDSLIHGTPFILEKKLWFPTKTSGGLSKDSAIFILRSYEIQDTLRLSMPVYIFSGEDSSIVYSPADHILFRRLVPEQDVDSLQMKPDTRIIPLRKEVNYPLLLGAITTGFLLTGLTGVLFGRPIRRSYRKLKLMRTHKAFLHHFEILAEQYTNTGRTDILEQALSLWKNYLSRLDQNRLETFTTTEICEHYRNEDLKKALRDIDRVIYGGIVKEESGKSLKSLKKFSNKRFVIRKNEAGGYV